MKPILDTQMSSKIVKDLGDLACGAVRFAGAANVADTITIGGTEVWTASAGGAGAGEYDQSGGTEASCAISLAAKINALPGSLVYAARTGKTVLLFPKTVAAGNLALAESTAGARTIVSAAAMVGSLAARVTQLSYLRRTINAVDATALAAGEEIALGAVDTTTEPRILGYCIADSTGGLATPANLSMVARQGGAGQWVIALADSAAVLSDTDVVTVTIGF